MTPQGSSGRIPILLSFSSAYANLARRLAGDLREANIEVRYDQWDGGGGAPAVQSVDNRVGDAALVVPLLTPSDAAASWIGDEWKRTVYDEAHVRRVVVLPVRGAGEIDAIPGFLRDRSFANLSQHYAPELQRLVGTIRRLSGNPAIKLPAEANAAQSVAPQVPLADALTLEVGEKLAALLEADEERPAFVDDVPMMRDGLFYELGVQLPGLQVRVTSGRPPWSARIAIYDIPEEDFWGRQAEAGGVI